MRKDTSLRYVIIIALPAVGIEQLELSNHTGKKKKPQQCGKKNKLSSRKKKADWAMKWQFLGELITADQIVANEPSRPDYVSDIK